MSDKASSPLFDRQMFVNMKIQWAFTLLGCLAAVLIPVPLFFYIYGPKLREKSKWAPILPPIQHVHSTQEEKEVAP